MSILHKNEKIGYMLLRCVRITWWLLSDHFVTILPFRTTLCASWPVKLWWRFCPRRLAIKRWCYIVIIIIILSPLLSLTLSAPEAAKEISDTFIVIIIIISSTLLPGSNYHFHKLLYHRSALRSQRRSRKRNSLLTLTLLLVLLWVNKQPFNLDQSFG